MVFDSENACGRNRRACLTLVTLFQFGLLGCNSETDTPQAKTADVKSLHTETERGPVRVSVDLLPEEPRLSDEPTLTLTIDSQADVDVTSPPFGSALGDFIIRDFYEPVPQLKDGRQILKQIYTLEPTRPGPMSIEPITISFVDNRKDGDGKEHTIETEALLVDIGTMIDSQAPSLDDLRPALPPQELQDHAGNWLTWGIAFVVLVVAISAVVAVRRRKTGVSQEPQFTPEELARRELDELIGRRISQTNVKEFFVELTGIVRRYIERSTGVKAPEQTTEEFLREVNSQQLFSVDDNTRLGAFLESADLVKFAGFQPDEEAIKQSTHKAKQFIELKADSHSGVSAVNTSQEASR